MLDLYIDHLGINPYTFYGISYLQDYYRASLIWTADQRHQVLHAMQSSRAQLEHFLGYSLMPVYTRTEPHLHVASVIRLQRAYLISLGEKQTTDLGNVLVDYNSEPAIVQITTDLQNLHLYQPETQKEIKVTNSLYESGVWTLSIPRYNLVANENNPAEGWDYEDLSNFLTEVQVKDEFLTGIQNGHHLNIVNAKMGLVSITEPVCNDKVYFDYWAGLSTQDDELKTIWVNFAHAKMDIQPTEDPAIKLAWLWARDIPKQLSDLQRNCPFGQFSGAYAAYDYTHQHRVFRARPL